MDYTIIYVHGFASAGSSSKGKLLRKHFSSSFKVLTPDLSHDPRKAIAQLEALVQKEKNPIMVGSSLGGFYADYFNVRYDVPVVLVNPLIDARDLSQFLGENKNYYTGEKFVLTQEDVSFLEGIQKKKMSRRYSDAPEWVLIALDDEVLDHQKAKHYFQGQNQIIIDCPSGGHRFDDNDDLIIESVMDILSDVWDIDFSSPFLENTFEYPAMNRLRERFVTLLAEPKDQAGKKALWPEVSALIELSYRPIGGFLGSVDELLADNTVWKLVRKNGAIVAGIIYKDQLGRKGVCGFTDGSRIGKDGLQMIVKEDSRLNRAWIEVSDGMERFYAKNSDQQPLPRPIVEAVMASIGKHVEFWHEDGVHYDRVIQGETHTKCMYGSPDLADRFPDLRVR